MKIKRNLNVICYLLLVLLIFCVVFSFGQTIKAASSDNGNADYTVNSGTRSQYDYTSHNRDMGVTVKSGGSPAKQLVNAFVQKQTENSKVVTWALNKNGTTSFSNILNTAKDYEEKHPEWKVVAGTNADQYYQLRGTGGTTNGSDYFYPQPYYPMIADGESWFSITVTPYGAQNVAGFLQDGSDDPIISGSANWNGGVFKLAGLFLSVVGEDGNIEKKFPVASVNAAPKDGETSLYTSVISNLDGDIPNINVQGENLFTVGNAELAFASNSVTYTYKSTPVNAQNAFFGKGVITNIDNSVTIGRNQFTISTKNSEVTNALSVGKKIIVQYEYEGQLGTVESAIGYHTIQRMDDKDKASNAAYNTKAYSRSLFGRTKDGKIVLITIDMTSGVYTGTSHDETNAVLKYYGCVEAYQMDGGGSVQAIARNNNDQLEFVSNVVSGARSVHSALLLVERREPVINVEIESIFDTSITLKIDKIKDFGRTYTDLYKMLDGEKYAINDGKVEIKDLRANREYTYSLLMDDEYGSGYKLETKTIKTLLAKPTLSKCEVSLVDEALVFTPTFKDRNKSIKEFYMEVDGQKYYPTDGSITISDITNVPKLVVTYDIGNGDYVLEVLYPHSLVLRNCYGLYNNLTDAISDMNIF